MILTREQFIEGMNKGSAYYIGCVPYSKDFKVLLPKASEEIRSHTQLMLGGNGRKCPFIKQYMPLRISDYDEEFIESGLSDGKLLPLKSNKHFVIENCANNFVLFPTDCSKLDIVFDDNFMNLRFKDTMIKRANRKTSFFSTDYDYRTSYYSVGKCTIYNTQYSVYCEGIEMGVYSKAKNTMMYSPSYFCLYAVSSKNSKW